MSSQSNIEDSVRRCEQHSTTWEGSSEVCPACQRDLYREELESIQGAFKLAVLAHENKGVTGAGSFAYAGDFTFVSPAVTGQMRRWIERWNNVLEKHRKL